MTPQDDSIFRGIDWLWGGILTILTMLTAALWSSQTKRIDELKTDHGGRIEALKSDHSEELRLHREHIAKLFDEIKESRRETNEQLMVMQRDGATGREQLLHAIYTGLNQKADK